METARRVQPIYQFIFADFLLGAASPALIRKHKISLGKIYVIFHFGIQTISLGMKMLD
jgi:hypothetical protein